MVKNVVTVMQNVIEQTVVGFTAQVGKRLQIRRLNFLNRMNDCCEFLSCYHPRNITKVRWQIMYAFNSYGHQDITC